MKCPAGRWARNPNPRNAGKEKKMTEQEKTPINLKDEMDLEEEIHDWRDLLSSKLVSYAKDTNAAKEAGQWDIAKKLEKEWNEWRAVRRNGYSRAQETELGRGLLAHVRERRARINAPYPKAKKHKGDDS